MRTLTNIPHKFDLKGLRVDDAFLGCKNCWWRAERGEVMKPICPECGEQLYAYYVRKEDLCEKGGFMKKFLEGFVSFEVAIYFRLDYNDNIDRCAFFEEINSGWREMYLEDT